MQATELMRHAIRPCSTDAVFRIGRLLPGVERVTERGRCHEASCFICDFAPWLCRHREALAHALCSSGLLRRAGLPRAPRICEAICLDIETMGLAGEPIFLVGLAAGNRLGELECHQLIARGLHEEEAVLAAAAEELERASLVITFNGLSFDIPYLERRLRSYGIRVCFPSHVDVLPEARMRFRDAARDFRLQTLEAVVCGRMREGDIEGWRIPGAYRRFLVTGDAREVAAIARHNVLDLAATLELLSRMWGTDGAQG